MSFEVALFWIFAPTELFGLRATPAPGNLWLVLRFVRGGHRLALQCTPRRYVSPHPIDGRPHRQNNRRMTQSSTPPTTDSSPAQTSTPVPVTGALLGLDFGTKRLGVAVCNSDQTVAVPVETWQVRSVPEQNLKHLRELVEDYRVVGFVIGLPVRLDGAEGDQAKVVRRFGKWLSENTRRPVTYWDERHSSSQAELLLWQQGISPEQGKDRLDKLAAQIILQSFLDAPDRTVAPQPLESSPPS